MNSCMNILSTVLLASLVPRPCPAFHQFFSRVRGEPGNEANFWLHGRIQDLVYPEVGGPEVMAPL